MEYYPRLDNANPRGSRSLRLTCVPDVSQARVALGNGPKRIPHGRAEEGRRMGLEEWFRGVDVEPEHVHALGVGDLVDPRIVGRESVGLGRSGVDHPSMSSPRSRHATRFASGAAAV